MARHRRLLIALPLALAALAGCKVVQVVGEVTGQQALADAARAGDRALEGVTDENEYYYGRGVSVRLVSEFETPDCRRVDPQLTAQLEYLNLVGGLVAASSDRPTLQDGWHFGLIDDDAPSAFSAPGGFVYVSRGLLRLARDEDELAAVLAHEVAHVSLKHGLEAIEDQAWKDFVTLSAKAASSWSNDDWARAVGGFSDSVDRGWSDLLDGFSVENERAADRRGLHYLARTGYDPNAMPRVLERLQAHQGGEKGEHSKVHPSTAERIDELRTYIRTRGMKGSTDPARTRRFEAAFGRG